MAIQVTKNNSAQGAIAACFFLVGMYTSAGNGHTKAPKYKSYH
jgi:hypothetical protein